MNIATEANITGKPANLEGKPVNEPPKKRPAKLLRWSIIVGLGLVLIVGAFVGFETFRSKQLAARQFGAQVTVDQAQSAHDQAQAGIAKTEATISQKLVRAPFDGDLGVRKVEVGQYLTAGTQIVSLTDLSMLYLNFTVT